MAAASREALLHCIDKHRTITAFDRAGTLAWTQAQVQVRHLGIGAAEADVFQRLAGHLVFAGPALRPASAAIVHGAGPQSGLWQHGISGDLPILLLRISEGDDLDVARQVILAQEYFRLKRLAVDVVILNEHAASYVQDLQGALEAVIRAGARSGGRGGAYLLRADLLPPAACALLQAVARVVLVGSRGSVADQLDRLQPASHARLAPLPGKPEAGVPAVPAMEFFNGLGGFADDGREYVVVLGPGRATPAPWINVVANAQLGFHATAEGAGCTWAGNSRENQLTPWPNDPVSVQTGEAFYLRDDATGDVWHPTAAPRRDPAATYVTRHGRGYSRFERVAHGIESSLVQFVAPDDPVKLSRLSLRNTSGQARSITVTAYAEWVLGPSRSATAAFVTTGMDADTGAMFAQNRWSGATGEPVAFADLLGQQSWTGDRRAFIGRNGTLAHPAALAGPGVLDNVTGAGLDPCGALRTTVHLPPGGEAEVVFLLGQAAGAAAARALVLHYRGADLDAVLAAVSRHWDGVLGAVQVRTPDRSMDIMLNGWLLYQTLACRVWARAGFYQASGAYGFRDQLQDGMALAASCPGLVREHLLRAAGRQFIAGDVQHWWLPQTGQGVRTRISDDCAWLAYAVAHYVNATGDAGVLDEPVPFLDGPALAPGEHDRFFLPGDAGEAGDLVRALRPRAKPQPGPGRPRPAAHGHRGLERRHEPRGRKGPGRERMAGLVPARGSAGVCTHRRSATRHARDRVARARGRAAPGAGAGVGWSLVLARVLRQRHANGVQRRCRVPDRLHPAILVRPVRRGGPGPGCNRHGICRAGPGAGWRRAAAGAHAALRPDRRGPGLHQGLPAGHTGKRGAIHPCGALVGDGVRSPG